MTGGGSTVAARRARLLAQILLGGPTVTNATLAAATGGHPSTLQGDIQALLRAGDLARVRDRQGRRLLVRPVDLPALLAAGATDTTVPPARERRRGHDGPRAAHGEAAGQAGRRRCLSCGLAFWSTGPGHRVCLTCKTTDTWRSPAAAHAVRCGH